VLFLTQEESVKAVSHQRERLIPFYRFSLPPTDVVDCLLHKQGFQQLAERLGAPVPVSVHVRTLADLTALEFLRYPAAVKPGERHQEYGRQFKKAYRVENAAEASTLLRRILEVMPDVMVQEWIEGQDSDIYFCLQYLDKHRHVIASFTGRKIRSWPPQVGGTASCTAAPEVHDELTRVTADFFQQAGVVGMASMEYKRDARTHEFRMVEPTIGRTDYQEEVATLNGVNLPYAAYCAELGVAFPAPAIVRRPVAWRVRAEDVQSAALQGQRPSQGFTSGERVADALWRWNDPLPFLVQNCARVARALQVRSTKVMSRSRSTGSKI
jgi:predicted ATP-grasp superfamily ATP-dependent carboligase